jgi:hypothetical protein
MQHEDLLSKYLKAIAEVLAALENVQVEFYRQEQLTPQRVTLKIRLRFNSGHLLEISEAVVSESGRLTHLSYRYHLQDSGNQLVFRYDDAPHFPMLASFPHHKHLSHEVIASPKPSIFYVIEEATSLAGSGLSTTV